MDASRYKDYMLGLMFYKFLSDKTLEIFASTAGLTKDDDLLEKYTDAHEQLGTKLDQMIQKVLGYFVLPEHLYQTWIKDINSGDFEVQKVTDSLNNFERTIAITNDSDDFKGLFSSSTLDLTDTALGSNLNERSKNIKALIRLFEDLDMVALQKGDVLGDAYEYLIGQFAMESGKKAGEFYTPRQVSEVMAQIVAKNPTLEEKAKSDKEQPSIYDATVGSGSLLLTLKSHLSNEVQKKLNYYGQEKNTATYNLTRMNLLLHGVRPEKMTIRNADTLAQDWPEDPEYPNEGVQFDGVVMNPPYSAKNWNKSGLKVSDPRFEIAGVLPPDSKGDFAFLLHGLYHLGQNGTMAIVLPHGVLFRGAAEGEIRQRLIDKNQIDAVIGLPGNLFTNTGIPVCVMILKKNRSLSDPVLIIDSSRNFIKVGKQNVLQEKDIAKIVDIYVGKKEIEGYSHLASREELINNEYNMNIPRYVEAIDDEIVQDVDAHLFGGIPVKNVNDLKILNSTVKDVLDSAFTKVREGYVEMNQSVSELTNKILADSRIKTKSKDICDKTEEFVNKYWDILRQINKSTNLNELKERMLTDIKSMLSNYKYIDIYAGYQIVAEIWKNALTHDSELIASVGFYAAGRTREKNMVTKGKNKERVQDGWIGAIIPNDLIARNLYSEDLRAIEDKKSRVAEIDNELSELVEAAKVEDSDENDALYDALKKNDDGEPQDSFENKKVKLELKLAAKGTLKYDLLKKVESLNAEKALKNKAIKNEETTLKEAIYDRITKLKNSEIDELVYEKWFGNIISDMANLVEVPLKKELETLDMLKSRYSDTLNSIDDEINNLEKEFESLMNELVVM
ncbi:hypothetical protein EUCAG14_18810 [Eubacterium callanderi]|nr:hypothetical protein EUCAG14_18810 [Eubacterium callanderi]